LISKKSSKRGNFVKAACLSLVLTASAYVFDKPASANVTRVSELKDVNPNVWAYKALKELVEKYDVLEGYADKTFRGDKPATRYEMAQSLYEVLKVMDVSNPVDSGDPETASRLMREFDRELAEIRGRIASLEGRVGALEENGGAATYATPKWTDRIRVSGDLTSNLQSSVLTGGGHQDGLEGQWGTRGRLGVDATLIADDGTTEGILGEGIAHLRLVGANGNGQTSFPTAGGAVDDVLFSSSSSNFGGNNNSSFNGRVQDSRMDLFLDQAYYTQVFKFSSTDPCSNEVSKVDNAFLVADIGLQDFKNTFHKSLVRENSIDGFLNQRVLTGGVGASNGTTEGLHLGLNFLGEGTEGDRYDACGNLESAGVDSCGDPLPSFFQALSLDYAFTGLKNVENATNGYDSFSNNNLTATGVATRASILNGGEAPDFSNETNANNYTTSDIWDNHSHNLALNLLYDLPGEFLGTGLFSLGASAVILDSDTGSNVGQSVTTEDSGSLGNLYGSDVGITVFGKIEQFFGKDRTFGWFADLAYADPTTANALVNGPFEWIAQTGVLLNTTFMPDTWNLNKDQLALAYSFAAPFDNDDVGTIGNPNGRDVNLFATMASPGTHSNSTSNAYFYGGGGVDGMVGALNRGVNPFYSDRNNEQIIEAYYRKYITENISITPDLQVIFNPNGDAGTGYVGTIRAAFKLPNWNDNSGAFDQFGYKDWSQRIAKYRAARSANY